MRHNILSNAKNLLVFQGDVEAVASQSPKEFTRLVEQNDEIERLALERSGLYRKYRVARHSGCPIMESRWTLRS